MKSRNPVVRDMVANPKRNQGKHASKRDNDHLLLKEALEHLEEIANIEHEIGKTCGDPECEDCSDAEQLFNLVERIKERLHDSEE